MLVDYLQGLSVRASRIPSRLRASGALGELRNTFEVLRFSGFSLFLFFSLSFFLHYLRINLCTFSVRVPGFFLLDLALLLNYATRGRAGGQGARVWGACFRSGFLYSCSVGQMTRPPVGGRCAIIAQIEGHHVSIKERQSNKQQERHSRRY